MKFIIRLSCFKFLIFITGFNYSLSRGLSFNEHNSAFATNWSYCDIESEDPQIPYTTLK